jgi:hypothetical protein
VSVSKRLDSKRCFDLVKVISMRTAKRTHVCVGTRVEYQIKKCIMTVPNTSNPPAIERNIVLLSIIPARMWRALCARTMCMWLSCRSAQGFGMQLVLKPRI